MTTPLIDLALLDIANKARAYAQRTLTREVPFTGSMGAAEACGFTPYSLEAKLFSPVYLAVLHAALGDHGIPIDADGYVVTEA